MTGIFGRLGCPHLLQLNKREILNCYLHPFFWTEINWCVCELLIIDDTSAYLLGNSHLIHYLKDTKNIPKQDYTSVGLGKSYFFEIKIARQSAEVCV